MGGSTDPNDSDAMSYDVTTVNLKTGEKGQAEDLCVGMSALLNIRFK